MLFTQKTKNSVAYKYSDLVRGFLFYITAVVFLAGLLCTCGLVHLVGQTFLRVFAISELQFADSDIMPDCI